MAESLAWPTSDAAHNVAKRSVTMREVIMLLNKHEGAAAGPVTASLRAKCCTTGATPYLGY